MIRANELYFVDNKSTNGTYLNGERITETKILVGDLLRIGSCEFTIVGESDFATINIIHGDSQVTSVLSTSKVRADALADKFAEIFDFYKGHTPEQSGAERFDLVRTQRLLNGLKTIYTISQSMTRLQPLGDLMEQIGTSLFELFAGAENLVILLRDEEKGKIAPRYVRARDVNREPALNISRTVLDRAVREHATLVANDASSDMRFQGSESIIGFSVKSVMCAPLVTGGNVLGALYLDNRQENVTYDELDAEMATAFANQCAIAIENSLLSGTLQTHYHQTLQALINAIEAKDPYTKGHTARVSMYATGIGVAYGLEPNRLALLKKAADLHDIGKIGIKERLINKSGKLTDTEYSSIKDHVEVGENILAPITYLQDTLPIIRSHHERWDGAGYPDGLKEKECPLEGRILALADAFDAMTSQRSYNKPLTFEEAALRVREASGSQFDPGVVEAFEKYLSEHLLRGDPARKATTSNQPA